MFLEKMKERVKGHGRKILFVDGVEPSVLQAARRMRDEDLASPIIMGKVSEIKSLADKSKIDLDGLDIHDPVQDENYQNYVAELLRLRGPKGLTRAEAESLMRKSNYFGAMMVKMGAATGMVSGLSSDTKPFLPAFQIIGLQSGYKNASSVFVLETPEQLLFFADCAVIKNPTAQELAEIAYATVETVKWLGEEPRVAMLSFSTRGSAEGDMVDKMKEATRLAKERVVGVPVDGELQFDAAFVPAVAQLKAPGSPFAKRNANIFIFPDLNSGNIAYKITERLGKARATGPILQGLEKPVNDVSRGCTVDGLVNAGVITAALAHKEK